VSSPIACSPGAKVVEILRTYGKADGFARFDLPSLGLVHLLHPAAFWILDQPFIFGNSASRSALTVLVKAVTSPSPTRPRRRCQDGRRSSPKMERIKPTLRGRSRKQQQAVMELYRRKR